MPNKHKTDHGYGVGLALTAIGFLSLALSGLPKAFSGQSPNQSPCFGAGEHEVPCLVAEGHLQNRGTISRPPNPTTLPQNATISYKQIIRREKQIDNSILARIGRTLVSAGNAPRRVI